MRKGWKRVFTVMLAAVMVFNLLGYNGIAQAAEQDAQSWEYEELQTVSSGDDLTADAGEEVNEPQEELDYILGRPMTEEEQRAQEELYEYYHQFAGGIELPEELPGSNTMPAGMAEARGSYPAVYDARNVNGINLVPEIRNQSPYGICWCYASLANLEINLIKKGLADRSVDLSEHHTAFYSNYSVPDLLGNSGTDTSYYVDSEAGGVPYYNIGGNQAMVAQALMNWKGAADESLISRDMVEAGLDAQSQEIAYGHNVFHMSNWYVVPATDSAAMKEAILRYGSVSIMYNSGGNYFNYSTAAQYCPDSASVDHAVAVIGWDDFYNKNNFKTTPKENGAWLVRNSWGASWGDEGYFWLSYEDTSLYQSAYAFEGMSADTYDNNYQYDHTTGYQYYLINHAANVYTAKANGDKMEKLDAVGIFLGNSGIEYSVQIYTNLTDSSKPTSGEPALETPVTGITGYAGYYMIPLQQSIYLEPGDTFAIVFDLNKEGEAPYVGVERSVSSGCRYSKASSSAGESFRGYGSGSAASWTDLSRSYDGNLKIKAYTTDTDIVAVPCQGIAINEGEHIIEVGETMTCEVSFTPSNTTNRKLIWSSDDSSVAAVNENGTITGVKAGTTTITAVTKKGGYSADWEIIVIQPVTSVKLSYGEEEYYTGESYEATVEIEPEDATDKRLTWSSSDTRVAEVDESGRLTVKAAGTVRITATAASGVSDSVTINAKEDKVRSFAKRMYTVALGREADGAGLTDWTRMLKEQEIDGAGIAFGFICSEEFKARRLSNSDYVDTLYSTFFDRAADREGKNVWMKLLQQGSSREYVLSGFVNSREFSSLCDKYEIARGTMQEDGSSIYRPGVRNFVLRLYTKALNRTGETMGVEDWTNLINTGQMTPEEVAKSFFASDEFINRKLNNTDYVEVLYQTFMDRASDREGMNFWLQQLQGGMSREQVLEGFSQSVEFRNIMASYGL